MGISDTSGGAAPGALPQPPFLPVSRAEMERLGWKELDVLLVSGDAYVDHPSFGVPLLGRWLVAHGFRTGIVPQPRWNSPEDVARLGRPRLFAAAGAGCLDSMLAHYTAFRKKRSDDAYTPGGQAGARPNRATLVYSGLLRQAFQGLPLVIGGVEASLRRATHYDFWTDKLRRGILLDAKASVLLCGMAERALLELAQLLRAGGRLNFASLSRVSGLCFAARKEETASLAAAARLPSHEAIADEARQLLAATLLLERQATQGGYALQDCGDRTLVFTPPAPPLTEAELDRLYALPFSRAQHPAHAKPVPAAEMIRFSLTSHRGCGGGCSFCAIAQHQGRRIASRSLASLVAEAKQLAALPGWTGALSDVGGPSANMWGARCEVKRPCARESCLFPEPCPHFKCDQKKIAGLLRELAALSEVKSVRVASGVRHDLALREPEYLRALAAEFTGGQLKLAPEHLCDNLLRLMRKPSFSVFEKFLELFARESAAAGKEQYVIPYLISAFPGCTETDMRKLSAWLRARGWKPQQVQCFIPTPGTVATAMYYAGVDPDGNPIHVARTDAERLSQHYILLEGEDSYNPPASQSSRRRRNPPRRWHKRD